MPANTNFKDSLASMENALANLINNLAATEDLDLNQLAKILRLVIKKEIIMEFLLEEINRPIPPPPPEGCVRTQGFWCASPQGRAFALYLVTEEPILLGDEEGEFTFLVDSQEDLDFICAERQEPFPPIRTQLLAAKLNIRAGADPVPIIDTIEEVDAFLAENPSPYDPDVVSDWTDELAAYNEGFLGVPHC